tara:strand:- start:722 stop:904 length:183 start_codon:yes stop_codon:yes gene_type:complete
MKKVKIKDNEGNFVEVDIKKFKKHLDEYHQTGSTIHEEKGHFFKIDQEFRNKIKRLYEQE